MTEKLSEYIFFLWLNTCSRHMTLCSATCYYMTKRTEPCHAMYAHNAEGQGPQGYWQEDCIYTSEVTKSKKRQVLGCQSAGQFLSGQIIVLLLACKCGDPAKSKWSHLASSSESYLTGLIRARRQIYVLRAVHDHRLIWKEARDCWKRNKDLTINTSGTELHCCLWHGILFCAIKSLQHDFSHLLIRIFIFLAFYVPKFLGIRAKI